MSPQSIIALLLLAWLPSALRAQSTNASLGSRVTDPSRALIAGAEVAAVNSGTNLRYAALTSASGEYPWRIFRRESTS